MADPTLDTSKFVTFEGSPFQLYQPFAPAGDQPEAIRRLIEGVGDGLSFQTLLGVTGSGKTFTMANVVARLGRPVGFAVARDGGAQRPASITTSLPGERGSPSFVLAFGSAVPTMPT